MHTKHLAAAVLAVALLGVSGLSAAAGTPQSAMHDRGSSMMGGAMMGGEMMRNCPMMGQLPPGNEKLAMQMHGEMMKAMGDIMLKYADKIQAPAAK